MTQTSRTEEILGDWQRLLSNLIELRPTPSNPEGLRKARGMVRSRLEAIGFSVTEHGTGSAPPVMVAVRDGQGEPLGLAGHYDVEEADEGWDVPPFALTEKEGRLYGRGTADNLGPLALRLATLAARTTPTPPLVWVLQGEEETGSALAHALYPELDIPPVALWVEETGYFEADGSQRLLQVALDERSAPLVDAVVATAERDGRAVQRHDRHLNKAFGQDRCPFLTHLAVGTPYLAIGPNDPDSSIHAPNESLPLSTLAISVEQFETLLTEAAR